MLKALIVDDEQLIRKGLRQVIDWEEHGIEIAGEAADGAEALEAIASLQPDILLTDIRMPVLDGLNLIRRLREDRNPIKIIIISGHDDFGYVKEALKYGVENYIVKPVGKDELSGTLVGIVEKIESEARARVAGRENENVIRDSLLHRLVNGRLEKRELVEKSTILGIAGEDEELAVCIAKPLGAAPVAGVMMDVLQKAVSRQHDCTAFQDLNGDFVLLVRLTGGGAGLRESLERCILECNERLGTDLFIAAGGVKKGLLTASESFIEARSLMQYYSIYPRNYLLVKEQADEIRRKRRADIVIDPARLKKLILGGKTDELQGYFDGLTSWLRHEPAVTVELMHALTVEVLACFIDALKAGFADGDEAIENRGGLFGSLLDENTPDGLTSAMKRAAVEISEAVRRERMKTPIDSIIDYIQKNYNRHDISLKTLSGQFSITTPYLGQMLKTKTGELFSDYLNGIRIGKAMEMLSGTNLKASEISDKVGYSDPNYFYRIFKKSTGVYPSEYREHRG